MPIQLISDAEQVSMSIAVSAVKPEYGYVPESVAVLACWMGSLNAAIFGEISVIAE